MKFISTKNITNILAITALSLLSPMNLQADTLGIYFSASSWSPDISGYVSDNGPTINIEDELGFDDDQSNIFSVAIEHPIFFLPNFKYQRTALDVSSSTTLSSDINFGGITYPADTPLESQIDLSHSDYIMYYEVLDNWVSLDLGITVMNFDGNINISSTSLQSDVDFDEFVPALYGKADFDLPFTGFYTGAEASVLSIGDGSISDYKIYLGWESDLVIGAEIGYHNFEADWEDFENSDGNISFEGYYATVTLHF